MGAVATARRDPIRVMVATPLEEALVRKIGRADHRVEVLHDPALLPAARYSSDHHGEANFRRDRAGERRWEEMLAQAEVLFGIPGDVPEGLADAVQHRAPRLRWIQATSAGAGEQVRAARLRREDLERVTVTTASGVHAVPLAEFCLFGLLAFTKDLPRLLRDKQERRWEHYPFAELAGRTVLLVGLGKIGEEVARLARCFGMCTIGLRRHPEGDHPHVDEIHPAERLKELIPRADAVVVTLPLTERTRGMIDREAVALMKPGCIVVNVGRGAVVDEQALTEALQERRIGGAALDVYQHEPLPPENPLWGLTNVLMTPHTAALSVLENERIVELFGENLRRYLDGEPLLNRVDPEELY